MRTLTASTITEVANPTPLNNQASSEEQLFSNRNNYVCHDHKLPDTSNPIGDLHSSIILVPRRQVNSETRLTSAMPSAQVTSSTFSSRIFILMKGKQACFLIIFQILCRRVVEIISQIAPKEIIRILIGIS